MVCLGWGSSRARHRGEGRRLASDPQSSPEKVLIYPHFTDGDRGPERSRTFHTAEQRGHRRHAWAVNTTAQASGPPAFLSLASLSRRCVCAA